MSKNHAVIIIGNIICMATLLTLQIFMNSVRNKPDKSLCHIIVSHLLIVVKGYLAQICISSSKKFIPFSLRISIPHASINTAAAAIKKMKGKNVARLELWSKLMPQLNGDARRLQYATEIAIHGKGNTEIIID